MDRDGCICVFAKPPQAGDVKTRLIPLLGKDAAAALAEAFLLDTWAAVCDLPWARAIIASTGTLNRPLGQRAPEVWLQGEGDLGARLERIFTRALESSSFALTLGADSPGLPASHLERARLALAEAEAVIGPCDDGGFYLLGLRRCPSELLAGISWSQSNTFAQTLAKLEAAGLRVRVLEPWFDVDRPRDLARLRGLLALGDVYAPKTAEVLDRLFAIEKEAAPLRISVIIPVLNEREHLPRVLRALQGEKWVHEVIVVDGGSTDGTWEWLRHQNCASALSAPRGKGIQLNAGARAASGDVLLFLHGDCVLPADAGQQISRIIKGQGVAGGCFLVQFGESSVRSLRVVAAGINLRTRLTRTATGEQAIFVRKQAFDEAGGCADWPLFEDVDLVRRIKQRGRFAVVRSRVNVSPRRHLTYGIFKTVLLAYGLRLAFWAGASPFALKRWFDDVRPHLRPHASAPSAPTAEENASDAANPCV